MESNKVGSNEKLTVTDVVRLIELVDKVQKKGHFASIEFSNYGHDVSVYFTAGGFRREGFDFSKGFDLTAQNEDIDAYHETVLFLTNVLEEI